MKVAIFHHFLDNIGGAEMVALTLARELKGDVFTTNINEEKISKMGFGDLLKRIYSIGKVPNFPPFKQQLSFYLFSRLNLKQKYDIYIITGDWAISASKKNHPIVWYAHSPLNEIWDFKEDIEKNILRTWQIIPYRIWISLLRLKIKQLVKNPDKIVCNSINTKNKIKKIYNKEAEVIYPPVDTSLFYCRPHKNYWLSVNRFVVHKRIEIQMETFKKLPSEKLIIVGSFEKGVPHMEKYKNYLLSIKPENVEVKHWVSSEELKDLYAHCKGLIATSLNEDFGLNAVEAMASGKPVIAPNCGGYKESIINKETGILIENITAEKIIDAIRKINDNLLANPKYYETNCLKRAKQFDTKVFIEKIKKVLSSKLKNN